MMSFPSISARMPALARTTARQRRALRVMTHSAIDRTHFSSKRANCSTVSRPSLTTERPARAPSDKSKRRNQDSWSSSRECSALDLIMWRLVRCWNLALLGWRRRSPLSANQASLHLMIWRSSCSCLGLIKGKSWCCPRTKWRTTTQSIASCTIETSNSSCGW